MRLVTFTQGNGIQRIGTVVDQDQTIVILQKGAEAKNGAPSPVFADMLAFLQGGAAAQDQDYC